MISAIFVALLDIGPLIVKKEEEDTGPLVVEGILILVREKEEKEDLVLDLEVIPEKEEKEDLVLEVIREKEEKEDLVLDLEVFRERWEDRFQEGRWEDPSREMDLVSVLVKIW